jgi:hypothetical protein
MTKQKLFEQALSDLVGKLRRPPNSPQAKREAMIAYQGWEDALAAWIREEPYDEEEQYSEAWVGMTPEERIKTAASRLAGIVGGLPQDFVDAMNH